MSPVQGDAVATRKRCRAAPGVLQGLPDPRHGFTLLELLVVLFLAALGAGAVTLAYRQPSAGALLKASAERAASRLRDLRVAAMATGVSQVALVDTARRVVHFSDRRQPLKLPPALGVRLTAAESEQRSPTAAGIRFFSNGSSSGGAITLHADRQGYEIRVNWLSGRVSTSALP